MKLKELAHSALSEDFLLKSQSGPFVCNVFLTLQSLRDMHDVRGSETSCLEVNLYWAGHDLASVSPFIGHDDFKNFLVLFKLKL